MSKVKIDFSTYFMENEHLPVMIDHQKITKRIYEKKNLNQLGSMETSKKKSKNF